MKGVSEVQQRIHALTSRRDSEEGFTLIELMVVVLIIAILIAIAIPTFLGARKRAQDRAAQSDLRNGLTAEKTFYTDGEAYSSVGASMKTIEPSLSWGTKLTFATGAARGRCDIDDRRGRLPRAGVEVGHGVRAGGRRDRHERRDVLQVGYRGRCLPGHPVGRVLRNLEAGRLVVRPSY